MQTGAGAQGSQTIILRPSSEHPATMLRPFFGIPGCCPRGGFEEAPTTWPHSGRFQPTSGRGWPRSGRIWPPSGRTDLPPYTDSARPSDHLTIRSSTLPIPGLSDQRSWYLPGTLPVHGSALPFPCCSTPIHRLTGPRGQPSSRHQAVIPQPPCGQAAASRPQCLTRAFPDLTINGPTPWPDPDPLARPNPKILEVR